MDPLLKVLLSDEKKIAQLTLSLTKLKKNIEHETRADKEQRAQLTSQIATLKKANSVIVNHYLGERKLTPSEIDSKVNTHLEQQG